MIWISILRKVKLQLIEQTKKVSHGPTASCQGVFSPRTSGGESSVVFGWVGGARDAVRVFKSYSPLIVKHN